MSHQPRRAIEESLPIAEINCLAVPERNAFKRLEERPTASGKSVKEEMLSYYKSECPCCGAGREKEVTYE